MIYRCVRLLAVLVFVSGFSGLSMAKEVTISDLASAESSGFSCRGNVQQNGGSDFGITCWVTNDIPATDTINLTGPLTFMFASSSLSSKQLNVMMSGTINVSGGASLQLGANLTVAKEASINLHNGDLALVVWGDQGGKLIVEGTVKVGAGAKVLSRLNGNGSNFTLGYIPPFISVESSGVLENTGLITTEIWGGYPAPSIITNSGSITNNPGGSIVLFPGSNFENRAGATVTNYGTIQNGFGNPRSETTVGTTTISNAGTIINNGTIENGNPQSNHVASISGGVIAGTGSIVGPGSQQNVTLIKPPGAPTGVTATAEFSRVSLSWKAPSDTGGGEIDYYSVLVEPGHTTQRCDSQPCHVNLSNGTTYTLKLAAHNLAGSGAYSSGVTKTPPFNNSVTFRPTTLPYAPNTTTKTSRTWSVPQGVSDIRVTAIGAGGGAGVNIDGKLGGQGGSGASVKSSVLPVNSGTLVSMKIGAVGRASAGGDCTTVSFSSSNSEINLIAGGGGGGGRAGEKSDGAAGGNGGQSGQMKGGDGSRATNPNDTNSTGRVGYPGAGGNAGTGGAAGDYWECAYQGACTQHANIDGAGGSGPDLQCYDGGMSSNGGGDGGEGYGGGGAGGKSAGRSGYAPGDSGGGAGGSSGPKGSTVSVAGNGGSDGSVVIEY